MPKPRYDFRCRPEGFAVYDKDVFLGVYNLQYLFKLGFI